MQLSAMNPEDVKGYRQEYRFINDTVTEALKKVRTTGYAKLQEKKDSTKAELAHLAQDKCNGLTIKASTPKPKTMQEIMAEARKAAPRA